MIKIYFDILRMFNKGEPSRKEADWALGKFKHTDRITHVLMCYADGLTYEQVGDLMKCTRERIRQIVRKGVRQARSVK